MVISIYNIDAQAIHYKVCCIYYKYCHRQSWANSVEPDQTPQNAASDQGLHYLTLGQQCFGLTSKYINGPIKS